MANDPAARTLSVLPNPSVSDPVTVYSKAYVGIEKVEKVLQWLKTDFESAIVKLAEEIPGAEKDDSVDKSKLDSFLNKWKPLLAQYNDRYAPLEPYRAKLTDIEKSIRSKHPTAALEYLQDKRAELLEIRKEQKEEVDEFDKKIREIEKQINEIEGELTALGRGPETQIEAQRPKSKSEG